MGDKWGCDEKHQKVRGRESYIAAVMDLATRFVLAWGVSCTKEKYDAVPLLRKAKDTAGRTPRLFITDSLELYHIAFTYVFVARMWPGYLAFCYPPMTVPQLLI